MSSLIHELERSGIAAASVDPDRRIVAANERFAKILGVESAALAGADIVDALAAAASETSGDGPGTAYRIGNEPSWHRLDLTAADGGFLALLTDVSEEHRLLEDIRALTAIRDCLLLDGKIGLWRFDPDAEMYHFSFELSPGHKEVAAPVALSILDSIQHPDDHDKDAAIRKRITWEGGYANAEMRYRKGDGRWIHLNVHYRAGRQLPSGRYEMFGVSQDITAVAIARDEAEQNSRRLALALRAARAGVFEWDYRTKMFWASPELGELVGSEMLKKIQGRWATLFVLEDRDNAQAYFDSVQQAAHASSVDLRMLHPQGHRWVKLYYHVKEREADGRPRLAVGLLIDIDEHKKQEIALAEARRAADFANHSKTEFLANMSHELRTPLNAILGFSEMIEGQMFGPIDAKYVDYVHDIHRSGEHLLALINDVLDLAKLEAGKLELHESVIALPALIADCLTLVRGRADAGRVRLRSDPAPTLPQLRADARAVKQVLLNFLSNAVKFTHQGGAVTVGAALDASGEIVLSVTDTGIGMSTAEVEVALSPFGQVNSQLAQKHEGTGLGLPICKSLMELHGGALAIASTPNDGTTLTARFPAYRTVTAAGARASA